MSTRIRCRQKSGKFTTTSIFRLFGFIAPLRNFLLILELKDAVPLRLLTSLPQIKTKDGIQAGVNEVLRSNLRQEDDTIDVHSGSVSVNADTIQPYR